MYVLAGLVQVAGIAGSDVLAGLFGIVGTFLAFQASATLEQ
jgi:hypothetical protein